MLKIQTNKLNSKTKKTMKTRIMSSFFIASFFIILFVLGWLSDNVNHWSPINSLLIRQILGCVLLGYILPPLCICAKEITNIFFKYNAWAQFFITISMIALVYAPTSIYFLSYYDYIDTIKFSPTIFEFNTVTNLFAIILGITILLVVVINTTLLLVHKIMNFKNWMILNLLCGFICGFYLGSLFFLYTRGFLVLLWLMLIVILCDSFSYFGGVLFGKHKMSKVISPNKTWEGFAFGQFITITVSLLILVGFMFIEHNPVVLNQIMGIQFQKLENNSIALPTFNYTWLLWWVLMFFVVTLLSILSVLGDLTYSLFKRKYQIKDYGTLIPGHGGIIDRIDSHSVVISFYFVLSFLLPLFANTIVFFPN